MTPIYPEEETPTQKNIKYERNPISTTEDKISKKQDKKKRVMIGHTL